MRPDVDEMICKIASKISSRFPEVDIRDIEQQGRLIAVDALRRYNSERGADFKTYIWRALFAGMVRFCASMISPVSGNITRGDFLWAFVKSSPLDEEVVKSENVVLQDDLIDSARAYQRLHEIIDSHVYGAALKAKMLYKDREELRRLQQEEGAPKRLSYVESTLIRKIKKDPLIIEYMS